MAARCSLPSSRAFVACIAAALLLLVCGTASARAAGTVQFSPTQYTVSENQGTAVLTLQRSGDLGGPATVYWFTEQPSPENPAMPGIDYTETNTHSPAKLTFAPGQSQAQITVPVTDHRMPGPNKQFSVRVFAKGVVGVSNIASVRILGNDPMPAVKVASDPLALDAAGLGYQIATATRAIRHRTRRRDSYRPDSYPLTGVRFYDAPVVPATALYSQPQTNLFLEGSSANMRRFKTDFAPILSQPEQMRFGTWDTDKHGVDRTAIQVSNYLEEAQANSPGTVPEILTYDLCHNSCKVPGKGGPAMLPVKPCGQKADTPRQVAAFENFIDLLASGISDHRVVLYLEMDGLISMQCLTADGRQTRLQELSYAIDKLSALPRTAVYVDGGAADAGSYRVVASYLNKVGVEQIQGFFLNSTHADWTLNEVAYGQKISRLTGGAHFIVNTTVNGRGPEATADPAKDGNEVLCNATTLGLGPKPTTSTQYWHVDAFAWLNYPGLSDGPCPTAPNNPYQAPTGVYMPAYAQLLIQHANYNVRGTVPKGDVKSR